MVEERGFTLTELLVVIAVMALLTALTVPNLRLGGRQLALDRSAQRLAQDIGQAAELVLRAQSFDCGGTNFVSGYGVYFDTATPTSYFIFVDCNDNQKYEAGPDQIIDTMNLESRVTISALSISPNLSITFVPPKPEVWLNPGNATEVQITLGTPDSGTRIVKVNNRGMIDVD
ncbi:MAG: type II secretion system protein [bacterium]|nr:type II secretion system protein [bacterium]